MLTGSDFIIVGKDAFYATMALFDANEEEARELIARDFKISPGKVYPVEQPGAYHLDLAVLLINDQTVMLRDPADNDLIEITGRDLTKYSFNVTYENGMGVGPGYNFLNIEFFKMDDGNVFFLTNAPVVEGRESQKASFLEFLRGYGVSDVIYEDEGFEEGNAAGLGCRMKGGSDIFREAFFDGPRLNELPSG